MLFCFVNCMKLLAAYLPFFWIRTITFSVKVNPCHKIRPNYKTLDIETCVYSHDNLSWAKLNGWSFQDNITSMNFRTQSKQTLVAYIKWQVTFSKCIALHYLHCCQSLTRWSNDFFAIIWVFLLSLSYPFLPYWCLFKKIFGCVIIQSASWIFFLKG